MSVRVSNVVLDIDEDIDSLKAKVEKKLNIKAHQIKDFKIVKESIDARKKNAIKINYSVEITCENEEKVVSKARDKDIKIQEKTYNAEFQFGTKKISERPIIVGMGPAGLFAGLLMAQKGYKPIIIERGEDVDKRTESINKFWNGRELNTESNVQFGEGGAGTFSDGKLTTRIKDNRCDYVLEEFIKAGAPEEIAYVGKPHIGTDILKTVVKNIRETIKSLGGEVRFSSKLQDIIIKDNRLKEIVVNGEKIPCETLILSIGHSARDTYEMLFERGIFMSPKPFAIGARIEHLQSLIDENQYGKYAEHPKLRAADYKLSYTSEKLDRSIYSFCMCPGGHVVAAASEEKTVVVNGMSYYKRDGENANSALVVSVGPKDFPSTHPLAGIEFQRHYESLAYKVGGENYNAPLQLVEDFLKDKKSTKLGRVNPTYSPDITFGNLKECLPSYVIEALREALPVFDNKIKGYAGNNAILTGIETRTSAPVRIDRNENLQSISLKGLYPCGEGAGYAGGIVSAAVDGLRVAEAIMKEFTVPS